MTLAASEARLFGVLPPGPLLAATVAVVVVAIVLFATGHWAIALVLVGLGLLGLAAFLEAVRRTPETPLGRRSAETFHRVAAYAGFAAEAFSVRSRVAREVAARRRELWELGTRRNELVFALGEAVARDDAAAADDLKRQVRELDETAAAKEREIADAVSDAEKRVRRAQLEVQPTEMVQVPEPYPPPDEGTPPVPEPIPEPMPAPIPEPYPPPDEGTPPSEPMIPEPAPPQEQDEQQ